ncbi:MAG TPA: hypothetical protein VI230_09020 [Ignavibacteriaceae bacterium]
MAKNSKSIRFLLRKITTDQFAILGECPDLKQNIDISTDIKFAYNLDDRGIGVYTNFKFITQEKPFLILEAGCHFQIELEDWRSLLKEDDSIELPKNFAHHLLMITVGTARGILHQKTTDTDYNKFFIPLMNVTEIVDSDITLHKE